MTPTIASPGHTCEVGKAFCPYCQGSLGATIYDLGKDIKVVGLQGIRLGKLRYMCEASAKHFNLIDKKVSKFPKGHCTKCGEKRIEGRYCPVCDV